MILLENISKSFGAQTVLNQTGLAIHANEKIGLIGPNGAGKTTLLRIIEGLEEVDAGVVGRHEALRIGTLRQEMEPSDRSILQETLRGDRELTELREQQQQMQQHLDDLPGQTEAEHHQRVSAWGAIDHRLEEIGSYDAESRASAILMGLGFSRAALDQPLNAFSGGWRMRVALAQLLFAKPDLFLLDEPTNHLDMESVAWFENYLRRIPQTFVAVSHDRGFLNRVTQVTVELDGGELSRFQGPFDAYVEQKAALLEQREKQLLQQGKRVEAITRFINRFRAKATKAKQVQSRVKQLQKMEMLDPLANKTEAPRIRLPEPSRSALKMVMVRDVHKGFGGVPVLSGVNFECLRGEKIGLLGPNGAGKTTLLKLLAGVLPVDGGQLQLGERVQPAYFTQHALDALNPEATLLAEAGAVLPKGMGEGALRTLLGSFLFSGTEVFKQIKVLSGGERARVALVRLFLSAANLLLLDEPTNHLDMESRAALGEALESYKGALILVTHDRDLMQTVCTRFLVVSGGRVTPLEEELESYLERVTQARNNAPATGAEPRKNNREQKRQASRDRGQASADLRQYRQQAKQLENRIHQLETEQATLGTALADPDLYQTTDKDKLREMVEREKQITAELEQSLAEWERVALAIEQGA
ncbi:MAG: ABC-F family ATP-binding cassette domain-containing protein [Magnetococcales bacterium]|nr:ABC-F family ATP-binding cassette domain-containing protein [Magnetococcales bacterium]